MLDGSEHSRRQFIRHLAGAGLLIGPGSAFLAACGGVKGRAQARRPPPPPTTEGPDRRLDFSNWPLYIDKSVLSRSTRSTAGTSSSRGHQRQLRVLRKGPPAAAGAHSISRDIVVLTDYMAGRSGARRVRHGDRHDQHPERQEPRPGLQTIGYDPKRNFTLPWQSGAIGIGYDPRKTGRKLHSIKDFFDPKFKGRVSFLSEPYDSAGMFMIMQGRRLDASLDRPDHDRDRQDRERAEGGQIRRFTGKRLHDRPHEGETSGSRWPIGGPHRPAGRQPAPRVRLPRRGLDGLHDNMMIPAKAAHPYAAEDDDELRVRPGRGGEAGGLHHVHLAGAGRGGHHPQDGPKLASSPLIFPTDAIRKKFHPYPNLSPADERAMEERMAQVTGA